MREILFRGKRRLGNEWIEGSLHTEKFTDDEEYLCCEINQCDVYPETVGQYTGYKIDDIKVFENDIAKVHLEIPYLPHQDKAIDDIGVVCFDTEDLRYYVVSNTGKKYALCYIKGIIGNIHDNPELLESEVSTI